MYLYMYIYDEYVYACMNIFQSMAVTDSESILLIIRLTQFYIRALEWLFKPSGMVVKPAQTGQI